MSTLPRDPSEMISSADQMPVVAAARHEQNLDEAIRDFTAVVDELGAERPSDDELRDLCQRVAAISGELFSNEWTVKVTRDPEIPGDVFFVFRVVATGNVDDIVARSNQWHIAVRRVIGSRAELFCLSFDVRE